MAGAGRDSSIEDEEIARADRTTISGRARRVNDGEARHELIAYLRLSVRRVGMRIIRSDQWDRRFGRCCELMNSGAPDGLVSMRPWVKNTSA